MPGSSRDGVVGWLGGALKIKVAVPPEKGKANKSVCKLLAGILGIAPAQIQVISGQSAPNKILEIEGLSEAEVLALMPGRK